MTGSVPIVLTITIRGVGRVVPEAGQHRIRVFGQSHQIAGRAVVDAVQEKGRAAATFNRRRSRGPTSMLRRTRRWIVGTKTHWHKHDVPVSGTAAKYPITNSKWPIANNQFP